MPHWLARRQSADVRTRQQDAARIGSAADDLSAHTERISDGIDELGERSERIIAEMIATQELARQRRNGKE